MTDLIPFDYSGRQVRTVTVDGEPWFVAADVCAVLGYANGRAAVEQHVPARHRSSVAIHDGTPGNPNRAVISEAGLYRLVMRSNALNAEQFQEWVTDEVIPTIRKTGQYGAAALPDISTSAGVLAMAEQFAATARQLVAAEQRVAELEPKAAAADAYIDATGLFLVRAVAKTLGVKESVLRQHCYDHHILMSHPSRRNEPYAEHVTAGLFEVKHRPVKVSDEETRAFPTTFVTPAGVEWLRRSLEKAGVIEPKPRLALVRADASA